MMAVSEKAKEKLDEAGKEIRDAVESLGREVAELTGKVKEKFKTGGEEARKSAEELAKEVKTLSEKVKNLMPARWRKTQVPVGVGRSSAYYPEVWEQAFPELRWGSDRMMEDFFGPLGWRGRLGPWGSAAWPRVDLEEKDDEIRIRAELPGVDKDDIDVMVNEDSVMIRGEKKEEEEKKGKGAYVLECYQGFFERRFFLPSEVEPDRAEATFKNGVLSLKLPKSPAARERVKKIAIRGE